MRYTLESTLPMRAFSPRMGRGPFAHGMTLEGGGGGGIIGDIGDFFGDVVEGVGDVIGDVAEGVGDFVEDTASSVGDALAEFDKSVGDVVPGGWSSVGAVAAMVAAPYASAYLMSATGMSSVAAGATYGAATGAIGAAASGGDLNQIITGAALGGLGGGIGGYFNSPTAEFSAGDFIAADARSMAQQGLSAEQIAYNLQAAGVDRFVAYDAGQLAAQGLSAADLAQNLSINYGDNPMFIKDAPNKIAQAVAEGYQPPADIIPETSTPFDSATTQMLAENGVTPDMVLDYTSNGFTDANEIRAAANAGFTNAAEYTTATELGFTTAADYTTATELGYGNAADFTSGTNAGFVDAAEYNSALINGGFDNPNTFNDALNRGFYDAPTYDTAMSNGFTNSTQYNMATELGYSTAQDYAAGTLGNFEDAAEYFTATDLGYTNASDYSAGTLGGYENALDWETASNLGYADNTQYQMGLDLGAANADEMLATLGITPELAAEIAVGGFSASDIYTAVKAGLLAPVVLNMLGLGPKPPDFTMPKQEFMPIPTYNSSGLINPGDNPGMIAPSSFYGEQDPGINQYYWGKHGYVQGPTGISGRQNYNLNTIAPEQPYGNPNAVNLGQLITPEDLGYNPDLIAPEYQYTGLDTLNTPAPVIPGYAGAFEPGTDAQMALGQSPTQQLGQSLNFVAYPAQPIPTVNNSGFTPAAELTSISPQELSAQLLAAANAANPG